MLASNACAVQMLLVAFSRRMCCSRVPSARRSAGLPRESLDTPTMRPGIWRLNSSRVAKNAARSTVTKRHAETLRAADGNVRTEFARRLDEREREQIRRDRDHCAGGVGFLGEAGVIVNRAERIGILHERAEDLIVELELLVIAYDHFNLERVRATANNFDGLRMTCFGDKENIPAIFQPMRHGHC